MTKIATNSLIRVVLLILLAWFAFACTVHYVFQRSLWNDELAVFNSILILKPSEFFTEPLRVDQVFPHFYLFCIQAFAKQFHNSILGLRFFSYMSMMVAFCVWLRVARRELKDPLQYLTFVMCWIASAPLIYYSAELKQYSMDVLVSGLFVMFLYVQEDLKNSTNGLRYVLILALLPMAVLFSYPAYFFLIFPLWNLCLDARADRSQSKFLLVYACSLLVCVALSYQFDVRLRPVEVVGNGFNDYFISTHSLGDFFQTFGEGINNIFSRWFVELPKIFRKSARVFMFFGLIHLFVAFFKNINKRGWKFCSIPTVALVVFFELAVAGMFQKYPFGVPRTALFLCPMILFLTVQGICAVKAFNRYAYYALHGSFLVYLFVVALGILKFVLTQPLIAIPTLWSS